MKTLNWAEIKTESVVHRAYDSGLTLEVSFCGAWGASITFDHHEPRCHLQLSVTGYGTVEGAKRWIDNHIEFARANFAPIVKNIEGVYP